MSREAAYAGGSNLRIAAVLAGTVAALYFAREVLIPLAFAIVLALMLSRVRK